jgi:hypothetical protein
VVLRFRSSHLNVTRALANFGIGPLGYGSGNPLKACSMSEAAMGVSTMMNRRKLICAGAAMLARVPSALAATCDLILEGGRVIDPSVGLDAIRDVAIAGGKIAALRTIPAAGSSATLRMRCGR